MVWGLIENFRYALQYRGGWRNLFQHMYTNGDFPFKFGSYMGCDAAGNRYYENRVDYPFGQHRWVEPGDIHNFDSTQIPPEWHGWMTSMNDAPPSQEDEFMDDLAQRIQPNAPSDAPYKHNIGYQNPYYNFNHMHNQSQIRSRGYGIGNPVVGLPPHAPDAFYTQPGSPYNDASIRKFNMEEVEGDLGDGRRYKNDLWKERLMTAEEKNALKNPPNGEDLTATALLSPKEEAILARGGTLPGK